MDSSRNYALFIMSSQVQLLLAGNCSWDGCDHKTTKLDVTDHNGMGEHDSQVVVVTSVLICLIFLSKVLLAHLGHEIYFCH